MHQNGFLVYERSQIEKTGPVLDAGGREEIEGCLENLLEDGGQEQSVGGVDVDVGVDASRRNSHPHLGLVLLTDEKFIRQFPVVNHVVYEALERGKVAAGDVDGNRLDDADLFVRTRPLGLTLDGVVGLVVVVPNLVRQFCLQIAIHRGHEVATLDNKVVNVFESGIQTEFPEGKLLDGDRLGKVRGKVVRLIFMTRRVFRAKNSVIHLETKKMPL